MAKTKEENNLYLREWRKKNRERYLKIQLKHYRNNRDHYRKKMLNYLDKCFYNGLKQQVLLLYGNKCAICGSSVGNKLGSSLSIHHIDKSGKATELRDLGYSREDIKVSINNKIDNLIPLCSSHHMMIHREKLLLPSYIKTLSNCNPPTHTISCTYRGVARKKRKTPKKGGDSSG